MSGDNNKPAMPVAVERAHTVEPLDAMGRPSKRAADRLSDEYAAVPAPTQIPESARLSEVMLLRGLECIASGYAAEADVIRAWAGEV